MAPESTRTQRVRLDEQLMAGWTAEVIDYAHTPPKTVPGTKRFVEASQIASLFTNSFGHNSGVMEKPIGLSAFAISPAKAAYLYVEPAKIRPLLTYDERGSGSKKAVSMWIPASAWVIRCMHERSNKWDARVAMVVPDDNGIITPQSKVGHYPLSNTYADYRICWGNVIPPAYKLPQQLRKIIDLFFASDFNGHTWNFNINFYEFVKKYCSVPVLKEMDDSQRWSSLMKDLPNNILKGTLSDYWKSMCGEMAAEDEDEDENVDHDNGDDTDEDEEEQQ